MSKLSFTKYHGTGNDFILIDDRSFQFDPSWVAGLCHRRFGIGADGVILLQEDTQADFRMRIYNCDGGEAESCGNGLCCLMHFIVDLGFAQKTCRIAVGARTVTATHYGDRIGIEMGEIIHVKPLYIGGHEVYAMNTGVPHAVVFSEEKLETLGPLLQSHAAFHSTGTNVDVAQIREDGSIAVRVYERGVGETMSCGTGAVAVGVVAHQIYQIPSPIRLYFPGGEMQVSVNQNKVTLMGSAIKVFEGLTEDFFSWIASSRNMSSGI